MATPRTVTVTLAYPIGDLLLLIFTIGALGMTGWRPGRVWLLIAASMLLNAIADSTYLYQTATNTYPCGLLAEACGPPRRSCWRSPPGHRGRRRHDGGSRIGGWWWCPGSRCSRRWGCSSTATSIISSRWAL